MTAFIATQCPHCLADMMRLGVIATWPDLQSVDLWYVAARCERCAKPISLVLQVDQQRRPPIAIDDGFGSFVSKSMLINAGDLLLGDARVASIWPDYPAPEVPAFLPDEVVRPYMAAERNFPHSGMEEAAAGSYGRALDVGTKLLVPQHGSQKLNNRIDKMRKEGLITHSLWEWAHMIKSIRNDALHEVESIDREELKAIRGFTETLLTYLFTLPAILDQRKAAAAGGLSAPPQAPTP